MVYLVFSFFIILFLIARKRHFKIASYLIGVYTFSVFFSIMLFNTDSNWRYQYTNLLPSVIFCVILLFYFVPFFKKNIKIELNSSHAFLKRFMTVSYGLSIVLIIGCIFLLTKVQEAIAYGLVDTRVAMNSEETIFTSYNTIEHIGHSTLKWLSGLCYTILILFFYAYSFIKGKYLLKTLLIISSLSATYLGLMVGGRTNLMYWILFFIFCLVLFWPYFSSSKKRLVTVISLVFLGLLVSYFIFISLGRAEVGHGGNVDSFLLSYAGQSYLNFCYFFENLNFHPYTTDRILPLTSSLVSGRFDLDEYREQIMLNSGMNIGIFYTFLGDLFVDVGIIGMLLYSVIYFLIAKRTMRRRNFSLSNLIILGILFQIPLHGVFYYSLWKVESSACIILAILIAKYLESNKKIIWKT